MSHANLDHSFALSVTRTHSLSWRYHYIQSRYTLMKHKEFPSALHRMNVFEYYRMVLPP
jgi:hypothetical protein